MRKRFDLGELAWTLSGWTPFVWRQQRSIESGVSLNAEIPGVAARVPGSAQLALREAGLLPDWNVGVNARECEWVENRHWVYTATLPDDWIEPGLNMRLRALGLDYAGWILLNGREVAPFRGSFVPHVVNLTSQLQPSNNVLQIVFGCPPRWLGQIGYTSRMTEWKPRFNYFWDWTARLVQTGIWDDLYFEVTDGNEILAFDCRASISGGRGRITATGVVGGDHGASIRLTLSHGGTSRSMDAAADELRQGVAWEDLDVEPWWPNGEGLQPLYDLEIALLDRAGLVLDSVGRRLGFTTVEWTACEGAPPGADPWLCLVNGRQTFLQGVNWTPIRPNFADVTDDQYRHLLSLYRDMGCTLLRVWGGAVLEKEIFYSLCDEYGLLVWQEFPLSSSGLDNRPPDSAAAVEEMAEIVESYIERRGHHVSLAIWCGGNELQDGAPITFDHPMVSRIADIVGRRDPDRRFLPSSPSGPRFSADAADFGKGVHWDVHGPWKVGGELDGEWRRYWEQNDALFHSEVGVSGASPASIIRGYKGNLPELPGTRENPLWRRSSWWIDWPFFLAEHGREPADLEEYVAWSQDRQRHGLAVAAEATRARFPRCGGFLVWMGHDSFPCTVNLSVVDFDGRLKPAGSELGNVYRSRARRRVDDSALS